MTVKRPSHGEDESLSDDVSRSSGASLEEDVGSWMNLLGEGKDGDMDLSDMKDLQMDEKELLDHGSSKTMSMEKEDSSGFDDGAEGANKELTLCHDQGYTLDAMEPELCVVLPKPHEPTHPSDAAGTKGALVSDHLEPASLEHVNDPAEGSAVNVAPGGPDSVANRWFEPHAAPTAGPDKLSEKGSVQDRAGASDGMPRGGSVAQPQESLGTKQVVNQGSVDQGVTNSTMKTSVVSAGVHGAGDVASDGPRGGSVAQPQEPLGTKQVVNQRSVDQGVTNSTMKTSFLPPGVHGAVDGTTTSLVASDGMPRGSVAQRQEPLGTRQVVNQGSVDQGVTDSTAKTSIKVLSAGVHGSVHGTINGADNVAMEEPVALTSSLETKVGPSVSGNGDRSPPGENKFGVGFAAREDGDVGGVHHHHLGGIASSKDAHEESKEQLAPTGAAFARNESTGMSGSVRGLTQEGETGLLAKASTTAGDELSCPPEEEVVFEPLVLSYRTGFDVVTGSQASMQQATVKSTTMQSLGCVADHETQPHHSKANVDEDGDSEWASSSDGSSDTGSGYKEESFKTQSPSLPPFDMRLLQKCMEGGLQSLNRAKNKHVILIMGKTGTGKSTLIQGIAGRKFKRTVHKTQLAGEIATKDVYDAENPLAGFDIGHAKESKTKSIRCFVPPGYSTGRTVEVAYVDTPGFEDTAGPEVDVATCVMINQVVRQACSLCFVIVINYGSLLEDRGGAMRGVLKLMRNFVEDLGNEKLSFMFLFTHTDEIKDVPESLDDARACLLKEIVRTMEGTRQGSDTMEILEHMQKSLTRQTRSNARVKLRYQLVDIIHPLKTDFSKLKKTIEMMKPPKQQFMAGSCGLSPHLQLKLNAGLHNLLQEMKVLLTEVTPEKIEQMNDLRTTLKFLQPLVPIDSVRRAAAESKVLVEKHVDMLQAMFNEEIDRGTNMTQAFSLANVELLKSSIFQLCTLQDLVPGEAAEKDLFSSISCAVKEFQIKVIKQGCDEQFLQNLKKIKAWSDGFEMFSNMYDSTCKQISDLLQTKCSTVSAFDASQLPNLPRDSVQCFAHDITDLNSICQQGESLLDQGLDVSLVQVTLSAAKNGLIGSLQRWRAALTSEQLFSLNELAAWAHVVELLQDLSDSAVLGTPEISKELSLTQACLEDAVQNHFANIFQGIKSWFIQTYC